MTIAEKIAAMQQGQSKPSKSLVLSSATAPTPVKTEEPKDERSLSQPSGQGIDQTPTSASEEVKAWHNALNCFESEMCITNDPQNQELAWIAIRMKGKEDQPILVHQLPFWEHPMTIRQNNNPF